MKKLVLLLLFLHLSTHAEFNNIVARQEPIRMTTSVIVPCVARHFFWLSGMLESYQNQTVRPDEIVVSLSEVEQLDVRQIDKLENGLWDFKLKVIRNRGVIIDGDNRTIAMDNSTGDILIFSDADDLPHPQRVEVAKLLFENYEVEHILHSYTFDREGLVFIDIPNIKVLKFDTFDQLKASRKRITTGSPCFLRKIGERLKWHAIKDVEYNREVYKRFKKNIVLSLPLILYRVKLSSHLKRCSLQEEDI